MTDEVVEKTVLEKSLRPLLKALHWQGTERQIKEAMPHLTAIYSVTMFRDVMQRLNFDNHGLTIDLVKIDERLMPCLWMSETDDIFILLSREANSILVFDGQTGNEHSIDLASIDKAESVGQIFVFKPIKAPEKVRPIEPGWFRHTFLENKTLVYNALLITFFMNLLALATPIYIMSVYDKVVGASSYMMLGEFTTGIGFVLIAVYVLHRLRAKILAVLGARFDRAIGNTIFERLLYLAPAFTESATVGSQVARIKDFDRLREFTSGPLLSVLFEVPFLVIGLSIIAILAGALVVVPVVLVGVFVLLFYVFLARMRRNLAQAAQDGSAMQEFLIESVNHMRVIKYTASGEVWQERFRDYSASTTLSSFRVAMQSAINSALSEVIMIGAGLAVLAFGAIMIINTTLSVGGLLATMILIWRVLNPLKILFNTMPRLIQIVGSLRQIGRLMNLAPETEFKDVMRESTRRFRGDIYFYRVSMRYPGSYTPSLLNVNFNVKAGSIVGVVGRNGSGKSTLLKLVLGMYQPQAGSIRIDGRDIRQLNPIELRKAISYLPQTPELFYGSIAANLRLADPAATDSELEDAARKAGILDTILNLPDGFYTSIRDYSASQLSSSFQQALCLARAYLKRSAIVLLDEPATVLDTVAEKKLLESLERMRGKATIMVVTHRPSHLKMMDYVLLLEQGQLILHGPPQDVLPKIPRELL